MKPRYAHPEGSKGVSTPSCSDSSHRAALSAQTSEIRHGRGVAVLEEKEINLTPEGSVQKKIHEDTLDSLLDRN
jgi:hypothetical protein